MPSRRFSRATEASGTLTNHACGGFPLDGAPERLETENRGVCGSPGRSWAVSDFLSGLIHIDVSSDQRSPFNRALHSETGAHAVVRGNGDDWLGPGLSVALFHRGKRRRGVLS